MSSVPIIVNCEWLKQQMDEKMDNLIIADVSRYRSGRNAKSDYECQHIPGAIFLDLFANVELTPSKPWNLATAEQFQSSLRDAGVNNESRVVLYSATEKSAYYLSARSFWMFQHFGHNNTSILDGGLQKWIAQGYPISVDIPAVKDGNFTPRPKSDLLTFDTMRSSLEQHEYQVCDTRPSGMYRGLTGPGHIPSAVNVPADLFVDEHEGVLKSVDDIKKVFRDAHVDISKPLATYCNSGMSACIVAMAAKLCGSSHTHVYLGGMLDWVEQATPEEITKEHTQ